MNTNEHAKNVQRFDRLVLTQVESIRRVGLSTLRDREHLDDLIQEVTTQPLASASGYRLLSGHDSSSAFEPRAV